MLQSKLNFKIVTIKEHNLNVQIDIQKSNLNALTCKKRKREQLLQKRLRLLKKLKMSQERNDSSDSTSTIIINSNGGLHPNIIIDHEECDNLENSIGKTPKT